MNRLRDWSHWIHRGWLPCMGRTNRTERVRNCEMRSPVTLKPNQSHKAPFTSRPGVGNAEQKTHETARRHAAEKKLKNTKLNFRGRLQTHSQSERRNQRSCQSHATPLVDCPVLRSYKTQEDAEDNRCEETVRKQNLQIGEGPSSLVSLIEDTSPGCSERRSQKSAYKKEATNGRHQFGH